MGYLAFAETSGGLSTTMPDAAASAAGFSPLEWSVIDLAGRDRPSGLGRPGPLRLVWRFITGRKSKGGLADPRLEALRRIAVLSWWRGYAVPGHEVKAFAAAGWSLDQYEAVVNHIADIRPRRRTRR